MMRGDASVRRINFIEREPFVITHGKMLLGAGAVVGFLLLIFALQTFRVVRADKAIVSLTAEVRQLKSEREKRIKETGEGEEAGVRATLAAAFREVVPWSEVLERVTVTAPSSLWLSSIKSYDRTDLPSKKGLALKGLTEDAGAVTRFLKGLADSRQFERVVLTSSKKETGPRGVLYNFDIDLAVSRAGREGS